MAKDGSITPETRRHKVLLTNNQDQIIQDIDRLDQANIHNIDNKINLLNRSIAFFKDEKNIKKHVPNSLENSILTPNIKYTRVATSILHQHELTKKEIFQFRENPSTLDGINHLDLALPMVTFYGINTENSAFLANYIIERDRLHPIEEEIINQAIIELNKEVDAEKVLNDKKNSQSLIINNNVVLISFFPRNGPVEDKIQTIKLDKNNSNEVETHTIVFWKTNPNEITIIDPSSRTFSEFLIDILNVHKPEFKKNINIEFDFKMEESTINSKYKSFIKVSVNKNSKIYNSAHTSNSLKYKDYSRDCTDIAIKIGFELIERQHDLKNTPSTPEIYLNETIIRLTNLKLPKEIGLFNPLHSSDKKLRNKAEEFMLAQKAIDSKYMHLTGLDLTKLKTSDDVNKLQLLIHNLNTLGILKDFIGADLGGWSRFRRR